MFEKRSEKLNVYFHVSVLRRKTYENLRKDDRHIPSLGSGLHRAQEDLEDLSVLI